MATLTIRLIRSFEYRTVRLLILHDINLSEMKISDLLGRIKSHIENDGNLEIFRAMKLGKIEIVLE